MLASTRDDWAEVIFKSQKRKSNQFLVGPWRISPKLDGICVLRQPTQEVMTGGAKSTRQLVSTGTLTRTGKPVPNWIVRHMIDMLPVGCHGEVLAHNSLSFQDAESLVMSKHLPDNEPIEFDYFIFNSFSVPELNYDERMDHLKAQLSYYGDDSDYYLIECAELRHKLHVHIVEQTEIESVDEAQQLYCDFVNEGYEGGILLNPNSPYVQKRSKNIIKVKEKKDAEFEVVEVIQEKYGENLQTVPTHLWGKLKEQASGLLLKGDGVHFNSDVTFKAGTGLSAEQKESLWLNRDLAIGRKVTIEWLEAGVVEKPRQPVIKCGKGGFDAIFRQDA